MGLAKRRQGSELQYTKDLMYIDTSILIFEDKLLTFFKNRCTDGKNGKIITPVSPTYLIFLAVILDFTGISDFTKDALSQL
jgi:hypothetical protein